MLFSNVYLVNQIPLDQAVKVATLTTMAVGLIYPFNAKFSLLGDNLPVKYPMHYVPEILMTVLSAAGLYLVYGK